ncbi:MAG: ATP-binding protein, partial [Mariprofundaceae bacterium]
TMVGGIAHNFNNMLAGMTGNLYLAKKRVEGQADVLQKLSKVEALSFSAAKMIGQLLTFARKGLVSMKEMPFTAFIREALTFLHPTLPEYIEMRQDICVDALLVKGDDTQLHQILMNLINNARDALEGVDQACITIRLESFQTDDAFIETHPYFEAGAYAHLSVADNGMGIPEHQLEHLFEPFFTTKEQGKGTGLGLSMVYGAIETHHGYVEVDSIKGKGSTFHIYIPLIEQKNIVAAAVDKEEAPEGNGELILLADDSPQIIAMGREVLESLGYRVETAMDGRQAVETFEADAGEIDLCIFDVVMPVMSGDKAAQAIRAIDPDIKIIFSTGYDKNLQTGMEKEAVLSKPFRIEEMSQMIRQQLKR